jgi:predicted transcriptional regulator of viral defense system
VKNLSFTHVITETVLKYPELKIIDSQKVYKEKLENVPEQVFYKTLSRLEKRGQLSRITKGVYCRPKESRFGVVISGEDNILEHFLGKNKNKGVVIGYRMYSRYGLTTQVSKTVEVYSNVPYQKKKVIRNVRARKVELKFEPEIDKLIELLEVLENYRSIEDLNKTNLVSYLEKSVENYNDKVFEKILKQIRYKKSTLASLKKALDYYNVRNIVSSYLRETSSYSAINIEELNEVTSQFPGVRKP